MFQDNNWYGNRYILSKYLNEKDKSRIIISDYKNSKYIIDTKMKRIRVNYNLDKNKNFKLFYQLKIENYPISSIYKRNN